MTRAVAVAIAVCIASGAHARPAGQPASATPASHAAPVPPTAQVVTATPAAVQLVAVVPADDARRAVVIGRDGEVYEPDGKGGWVHRLASSTAGPVVAAGRVGDAVVALGDGVMYRLAATGWSAIRLVRRGKAILGGGQRPLAAVGHQLFALDQLARGEPIRLARAPAHILAIGASARAIVVATGAGVFRLVGTRFVAMKGAPRRARPISDRWAIVDRGAVDLTTGKLTAWPGGLAIGVAAAGPGDALVAIGAGPAGLELVTLGRGKLARDPLGVTGTAVGVVVDRAGRAVVALSDGRIAVRDRTGWTTTAVVDAVLTARPGPGPAISR